MIRYLDMAMCFFWILTYVLVLASTIKYRYPTISPFAQLVIAPFEYAVLVKFFVEGAAFGYAFSAYLAWALIDTSVLVAVLIVGRYQKRFIVAFALSVAAVTGLMIFLVICRDQMFFFSYFNTLLGEFIWFVFVLKREEYPIRPLVLLSFLSKLTGDTLAISVYLFAGSWFCSLMCLVLPLQDLAFVAVYLYRAHRATPGSD